MRHRQLLFALGIMLGAVSTPALAQQPSGTLPVVYLSTLNGQDITTKDYYVTATFRIDSMGTAVCGSAAVPDTTQVKGRGNWTWNGYDKKPYRLKLNKSRALLGMNKSKHWALMAAADDNLGFLKNPFGYMLSEHAGMSWTPDHRPVELVLNGQYHGLYFLTETVRIDKKRVNVVEQRDGTTDTDSITGGWLVEIDNYLEDNRVDLTEGNGEDIHITPKTPEVLSSAQRTYLTAQMNALNTAFYDTASGAWTTVCDVRDAARFYLIQELMVDCESYHGSCYLVKNMDSKGDPKWHFGPVWDFGNAFNRCMWSNPNRYIFEEPEFSQIWIGQMYTYSVFRRALMEEWYTFYHNVYPTLQAELNAYAQSINAAAQRDRSRWQGHGNVNTYDNVPGKANELWGYFQNHVNWLHSQWGEGTAPTPTPSDLPAANAERSAVKRIVEGRIVIERGGAEYEVTGKRQ